MRSVPYYHVDAFAERPFTGNQAAVLLLEEWPDDGVLQAIAAENNFADSAFLVPETAGEVDWQLRWFTPTVEVRLCGHATFAAGHVLLERDASRSEIRFRTRLAGDLTVSRGPSGNEMALPAILAAPEEWPEAIAAIGRQPVEMWRALDHYNILLYDSEEQVRSLTPDFAALGALGHQSFAVTARGGETDVVSRVFLPGAGIDEDSVTGSAHAVLTPFWAERLRRGSFTALQASARRGYLNCRLDGDRVWLGGNCVMIAQGRYFF